MAVKYNQYIIVFFLLLHSFNSNAEKILTNEEKSIVDLSLEKFTLSKQAYETLLLTCEKSEKIIPSSLLIPLDLTVEELKTALFILSERANSTCYHGTDGRLLIDSAIHRATAKKYSIDAGKASIYDGNTLFSHHSRSLRREVKYLQINKNTRIKLESIKELQAPFLVIETLNRIHPNWENNEK